MADKFDTQVKKALMRGKPVKVLVQFSDCQSACAYCESKAGARASKHLTLAAMEITRSDAPSMEQDPRVVSVHLDERVQVQLDSSVPVLGTAAIRQTHGFTGSGVKTAVLDTGTDLMHLDFSGRIAAYANFTDSESVSDLNGHGTHVASIALGSGAASSGLYKGVAPESTLLSAKVLGDDGLGLNSWVISGIDWALDNGAQVINLSLGSDAPSDGKDPLSVACNQAVNLGAVVVLAAGNAGPQTGTIGSPAAARNPITVGNVKDDATLVETSSRGTTADGRQKPEIVAPGHNVIAARASGTNMGTPVDTFYTNATGTSMAAPHISGLCALMLQANPTLTPFEIKQIVINSASRIDASVEAQGFGLVSAEKVFDILGGGMSVRLSSTLRTVITDIASIRSALHLGVIDIYDGPQPLSADMAPTGRHLARITQNGDTFVAGTPNGGLHTQSVSKGVLGRSGLWRLKGISTGTPTWFRWKSNQHDTNATSDQYVRLDGAIGRELILEHESVTPDTEFNINSFSLMLRPQ